jgi:hypothetical protein
LLVTHDKLPDRGVVSHIGSFSLTDHLELERVGTIMNSDLGLPQGDPALLATDLAQELLRSAIPARLAFVWTDGTARAVPTWFHWTGEEIVMVTYTAGPAIGVRHSASRLAALRSNPAVALTVDTEDFPPRSLNIRGRARITEVDGIAAE